MTASATTARAPTFQDEVVARTPGEPHLERCIQCGTCGGSCPSGADMEHTPRGLFAMINAGMKNQVLRSNTPWYCVSCYYCTVRCPQQKYTSPTSCTRSSAWRFDEGLYDDPPRRARLLRRPSSASSRAMAAASSRGWPPVTSCAIAPSSQVGVAPMALAMLRQGQDGL